MSLRGKNTTAAKYLDLWEVGGHLEWWEAGKCVMRTAPVTELIDLEHVAGNDGAWEFTRITVRHAGEPNATIWTRDVVRKAIFVFGNGHQHDVVEAVS